VRKLSYTRHPSSTSSDSSGPDGAFSAVPVEVCEGRVYLTVPMGDDLLEDTGSGKLFERLLCHAVRRERDRG